MSEKDSKSATLDVLREAFWIALANLMANPIRSVLSILGIVIGISAVVAILALGEGTKTKMMESVNTLGVNVYRVYAQFDAETRRIGELRFDDVTQLQNLSFVETAFPDVKISKKIRTRQALEQGTVRGIHPTFLKSNKLTLLEGRNISPIEYEGRARVCMMSDFTRKKLFPDGNALGKEVFVDETPWQVIGIYDKLDRQGKKQQREPKVFVLVPITTLFRTVADPMINEIKVFVKPEKADNAKKQIQDLLERDDPNRVGLYEVWDQQDSLQKRLKIGQMLATVFVAIGAISLLVGGIGMMNVMLTSVAERTREIGIRRAVGARKRDILYQFLVESCVLSGIGGLLGLLLGVALAHAIPFLFEKFSSAPPEFKPFILLLSVGSGIVLGIAFGFYPAIKASRLSPVEALRVE